MVNFPLKNKVWWLWSTEMNFLLQMPEWSLWNVKLIMFLSCRNSSNDSPQPSQSSSSSFQQHRHLGDPIPATSAASGAASVQVCTETACTAPPQPSLLLPQASLCLEGSCELSLKSVELLDTCHSEVTFSAKQQQLNFCLRDAPSVLFSLGWAHQPVQQPPCTCPYPLPRWNYLKYCPTLMKCTCCLGRVVFMSH